MQSSTTIRIYGAKTLSNCLNALSMFGEIARIDVTQAESLGYSTATFFDVRGAQCALQELGERLAAPASAEEQDFRALAAPFEIGPAHYRLFGEVADWRALPNGCLGVEFFDMRALQRALVAVEGSQPVPVSFIQASMIAPPPGFGDDTAETISQIPRGKGTKPVAPDEFASLELDLDKISSGEDKRTTVMLRRFAKSKTQADLVIMLGQCGLAGRYTFLYMPFDKRKNCHCRLAFVDFVSPQDVWQLETSLRMFRKLAKSDSENVDEQLAVVSYARLQGRQQLLAHFGTAAVMHDKDVSRRPMFMSEQMAAQFLLQADQDPLNVPATSLETGKDAIEPIDVPVNAGAIAA